jgi:hypothetical protein
VRALAAGRADPFDDEQRGARRNLDLAVTVMLVPFRRAEANRLPSAGRIQDAVDQQVGPAKAGMPSGDVIGSAPASCRAMVVSVTHIGLIDPDPSPLATMESNHYAHSLTGTAAGRVS